MTSSSVSHIQFLQLSARREFHTGVCLQVQTELRRWLWKCHSQNHLTPAKRSITQITIRTRGGLGLPPSSGNISSVWFQRPSAILEKNKNKNVLRLSREKTTEAVIRVEHANTLMTLIQQPLSENHNEWGQMTEEGCQDSFCQCQQQLWMRLWMVLHTFLIWITVGIPLISPTMVLDLWGHYGPTVERGNRGRGRAGPRARRRMI